LRALALLHQPALVDARIDEEMEPEGLQREEDEAGLPVQKAEPEQVAVKKEEERAQERRHAPIEAAQGALALDRRAGPPARDLPLAPALDRHRRLRLRPAQMAARPFVEAHAHVVDHRRIEAPRPPAAGQQEMLVVEPALAAAPAAPE
jgi:hypothetical protein